MLLTDSPNIPVGDEWLFEAKYDGFRCILVWEKGEKHPNLISRNGNVLSGNFPEVIEYCERIYKDVAPNLPLSFDGELVYLKNDFHSDFSVVQKRRKMANKKRIELHAKSFPCHFIVFDLLQLEGQSYTNKGLKERKHCLKNLFKELEFTVGVNYMSFQRIMTIDVFTNSEFLLEKVKSYNGEGIVAKKMNSTWNGETRTKNWLKIKNWRYVNVIVTKYDQSNGFFTGAIYKEEQFIEVVTFKNGLKEGEQNAFIRIFKSNGTQNGMLWELPPSICVTIACIGFDGSKLREPRFHAFQHQLEATQCNWRTMQRQLDPIPEKVTITNPDKPVFPDVDKTKDDYLLYLQKVAPYLQPFLKERLLTIIRYPHGVRGERFYQKNFPENIPSFVDTCLVDNINFAICNNIETLLWLGNQLAIEFHIPSQTIHTDKPTEIVFDLDPPSVDEFHLAVNAALKMKTILDHFKLTSYIKTSGGKGMQIYIPLPLNTFTYEQTGIFTEFVCNFLAEQYEDLFTTERMKKNRKGRLYLDYVQHRDGKTIIAPYSTRGTGAGLVATPLFWEEVNEQLSPATFTMDYVIERIEKLGNPFRDFRVVGEVQPFSSALNQIKGN